MNETQKIVIAGAGLGGLTAAACLLKAGHDVHVFEQAPVLGEVGAGIQASANASRVLLDLGLRKELEECAVRPERVDFRLHDTAEVVSQIPLGDAHEERFGAPYYQLYRPDLHEALKNKVRAFKSDGITLNATVTGYTEEDDKVYVHLANGDSHAADILIGADGIKSNIRTQMHGVEAPNFTGQVAYRGLIPADRLPEDFMPPIFVNWMGPRTHMVVYWVHDRKYLNFVGCTEKPDWTEEGWTIKAPWEDLKAKFQGFHPDVQKIIDEMDHDAVYCWALNIRDRLPYWSTGRVTLMGDACHPTIPYMAQGAVMAIEDAAVLTRALAVTDDVTAALKTYQAARMDRAYRIVDESTIHARLYHHESHDEFRAAFAEKDPAADRAKWLYSYDPLSVPLPVVSHRVPSTDTSNPTP